MNKNGMLLTAPKKTWYGQLFPHGSFSVATFGFGGQVFDPKCTTFHTANAGTNSKKR
jgi:hypothetical protein